MARRGSFHNDNALAQYTFDTYSQRPPSSSLIRHSTELTEYLKNTYNINFSDEYIETLNKLNIKCRRLSFSISKKSISSIIDACVVWKEYIDINDFEKLVCGEIISMITIHSSIISARNFEVKKGISLTDLPSPTFTTIVNSLGNIAIYE